MPKISSITRRAFLAITGFSGAGLMLNQGEKIVHKLIPYVNPPSWPTPGEWAFYSTTCRECPAGCGLLMWHRDGRSTKAEGNPENPVNAGKICIRGQSSVQGEYDPDRLNRVLKRNEKDEFSGSDWENAMSEIRREMEESGKVSVISGLETGSRSTIIDRLAGNFGQKTHYYEAFNYESMRMANQEMYGLDLIPRYDLEGCDLILSFGVDFLETWLSPVEYARNFGEMRSVEDHLPGHLLYFGSVETLTATNADDFIVTSAGSEAEIILSIAARLRRKGYTGNSSFDGILEKYADKSPVEDKKMDEITGMIMKARAPIALAGRPEDHSVEGKNAVKAANLLNELLGSSPRMDFNRHHALSKTARREETNRFFEAITPADILIIHNTNPVYSLPGSEEHIRRAKMVVFIGDSHNETAGLAHWILPAHYPLEDWGDYEPWNGTVSLMQPTMAPLYDTRSSGDIFLNLISRDPGTDFKSLVRSSWLSWSGEATGSEDEDETPETNPPGDSNDRFYRQSLRKGYLSRKTEAARPVIRKMDILPAITKKQEDELYLRVIPSLFFYDGRLSNRPWLQEIPHQVSNIVWQSWIDMNPEKAKELGIEETQVVKVKVPGGDIEVPVRFTHHIDKETVAVYTGQGHTKLGRHAKNRGVNAFAMIPGINPSVPVIRIEKTSQKIKPIDLANSTDQFERDLVKYVERRQLTDETIHREEITYPGPSGFEKDKDLYEPHAHKNHRWAMVIDLQRCIGCKACESACYAENNIAVLGEENMREGREMSWLKVINYKINEKKRIYLPLPCQHCDAAPCEPVCPVYAAVHTEEGLNAQIYNRCIGTRYCSNNCPYKVRRFNWVNVDWAASLSMQLNPEVTVRQRGVMEKCTFCVQRIRSVEYKAREENRKIRDQEIVPACAQTCPTNAIIFGDLHDPDSMVNKLLDSPRRYQLLRELNTKPGVIYLKKVIDTELS